MERERPGLGRRGVLQHAEGPLFCCFEEEAEVKTTKVFGGIKEKELLKLFFSRRWRWRGPCWRGPWSAEEGSGRAACTGVHLLCMHLHSSEKVDAPSGAGRTLRQGRGEKLKRSCESFLEEKASPPPPACLSGACSPCSRRSGRGRRPAGGRRRRCRGASGRWRRWCAP